MKKIKFLPLFFILCLALTMLCAPFAAAVAEPEITVPTAMVVDQRTGEVIYSRGADTRIYPASTTKVMTVLLAVEAVERGDVFLSDEVTVKESAMQDLIADGSSAGIIPGETMTLENLLYCAMISSANEACNIIAEHVADSIPEFVTRMNDRAAQLGCTATHFANTHGLPNEQHYITASDFSLIALEALRHPQFMKLCGTADITIPATNVSPERSLSNSNALLSSRSIYGSGFVYEGATGIKTGHTNAAGYCLASSASRDGLDFLVLVFGAQDSDTCFRDSVTLLDWAFGNYSYQEILKSTENIASVDVALGSDVDYVNLRPSASISALLPNDVELSEFRKDIRVFALENGEPVTAPVAAGQVLGEVSLSRDGRSYGTVKLVASASVDLSRMQYIKSQIRETLQLKGVRLTIILLVLLLLLYIAWVIVYRVKRIRHLRAVRAAQKAQTVPRTKSAAPAEPVIDYFAAPSAPSAPAAAPAPAAEIVELHRAQSVSEPPAAPAPEDDLLRGAECVAELPADDIAQKADRDYFEEFFRSKK